MKLEQIVWAEQGSQGPAGPGLRSAQWVLVFGGSAELAREDLRAQLRQRSPAATLMGCTTAGEIAGARVRDRSMSATAVQFEHTRFRCAEVKLPDAAHSREAGAALAEELDQPGLTHVFVISEGLKVNGSELVRGLTSRLPPGVAVTGELSGDGDRFGQTLVWLERSGTTSAPTEGKVIGIGFAGGCGWATAQSAGGTPSARSAW